MHIDVDPAEINKNKEAHIPMCTETRPALAALNKGLDAAPLPEDHFAGWQSTLKQQAAEHPMLFPDLDDVIIPQRAIQVQTPCGWVCPHPHQPCCLVTAVAIIRILWSPASSDTVVTLLQMLHEETDGKAVITTGVGQHQMWAAQWYDYDLPRHWATSGELQLWHTGCRCITARHQGCCCMSRFDSAAIWTHAVIYCQQVAKQSPIIYNRWPGLHGLWAAVGTGRSRRAG